MMIMLLDGTESDDDDDRSLSTSTILNQMTTMVDHWESNDFLKQHFASVLLAVGRHRSCIRVPESAFADTENENFTGHPNPN